MGSSSVASSEELAMSDVGGGGEDKILVSIRLRPLSEKEIARHDLSDWECMDDTTLIFRNSLPERSMYPCAYTFDRVFGCDSSTRKVYEEGAKEVALSVVNGINSSIFAYGQTSSGKTYTMSGITAFAVADIYDYIEQRSERDYVMKFAAMEIYNEAVRDLLSSDNVTLRLLDYPERGTVVERLTEETLRDRNHLAGLMYICEAQRKIGETSLNETSSRSHQILRLTIESSARDGFRAEISNTLAATVNFVDLAGSERASQTQSAGTRLKEGCHINRSLLTLGTVIRKLSKGRNVHVPYRDSKLTRILQHSLGGNARTAIICTINPARSHVEQSRNTLLFAGCAKEVSTNAQVNVVMSDKALVKQLQKELGRLESHVKTLESTSASGRFADILRQKEIQIQKMEKEIKELTQERDIARAQVQELQKLAGADKASRLDQYSESGESSDVIDPPNVDTNFKNGKPSRNYSEQLGGSGPANRYLQVPETTDDNFLLDLNTPKFPAPDPSQDWDIIRHRIEEKPIDTCKDVQCIETNNIIETSAVSSRRGEGKDTGHSRKDYSCDTSAENQDTDGDSVSSRRKEDNLESASAELFHDTVKQENRGMDEKAKTSPRKEDNPESASAKLFHDIVKQENHGMDEKAKTSPRKEDNPESASAELFHDTVKQENHGMDEKAKTSPRKEDCQASSVSFHNTVKLENQDTDEDSIPSPRKEDNPASASAELFHDTVKQENHDIDEKAKSNPTSASAELFHDTAKQENQDTDGDAISSPRKENNPASAVSNADGETCACEALQQKVEKMQKAMKHIVTQNILEPTPCSKAYMSTKLARSRSSADVLMARSPSPLPAKTDKDPMEFLLKKPKKGSKARYRAMTERFSRQDSLKSVLSACLPSDHIKMSDEDVKDVDDMYAKLQELAKSQVVTQFDDKSEVTDYEDANEEAEEEDDEFSEAEKILPLPPEDDWPKEFQKHRNKIIELWDACYVPLVHRTYFFLLFKGDPSDSIYMEVELRKLSYLKTSLNRTNLPKTSMTPTRASSIKALTREREMLAKQMHKKVERNERESIYKQWGVNLSTKQRSVQVTSKIWTQTNQMRHVEDSAALVARLMEPGHQVSKEMFGLSFSAAPPLDKRSYSWRSFSNPFEV